MTEQKLQEFLQFCLDNGFDITSEQSKQREAILSNTKCVIPAGAGSGKTTVLTYRFLRLLVDDEIEKVHSDEILTITFTKAATANMKAKIYRLLKKAVNAGLLEEEEINRFSNAEISTTDSFCSRIARMDSTRYGIAPDFMIEEQSDLDEFAARTIRKILDVYQDDPMLLGLLGKFSVKDFEDAFQTIASNYINIAAPLPSDPEEINKLCKDNLVADFSKQYEEKRQNLLKDIQSFNREYAEYDNLAGDLSLLFQMRQDIDNEFYGNEYKFSTRKTKTKDDSIDSPMVELRKSISKQYKNLSSISHALDFSNIERIDIFAKLYGAFQEEILHHKRANGLLTFHDVMALSIHILKDNKEIRNLYRGKYKRIMVDEFQDNNTDNKNLVYLLSTNDSYTGKDYPSVKDIRMEKIFMVGDEKQSIYKFRGADVSVFKAISEDFGKDRVLSLDQNYRSEKTVIDSINSIFSGKIMDTESTYDFEAQYRNLISANMRAESTLEFLYMDTSKAQKETSSLTDNAKSEAYAVASYIKNNIMAHKENFQVPYLDAKTKEWKHRDPEFADIAILLKTGSRQGDFEKALKVFHIPFNVSDNKSLTTDAIFNDFYNVLQLVTFGLEDTLSLAAFLKSPLCGLKDGDIQRIVHNALQSNELDTNLSETSALLLTEGLSLLEDVRKKLETATLAQTVDYIWNDLGYRFFVEASETNLPYLEHFEYLFALAASYDEKGSGVVEMLDQLRPMLGDSSKIKDLSIQKESTSGLTIQSIHKSKGLEYPIVFVSDIGSGSANDRGLIIAEQPGTGLPIFPIVYDAENNTYRNPYFLFNKNLEVMKENAETKRVLYVAATRAVSHLVFSGVYGKKIISKDHKISPVSDTSKTNMIQYLTKGLEFNFDDQSSLMKCTSFDRVYCSAFRRNRIAKTFDYEAKTTLYVNEEQLPAKSIIKKGVTTLIEEEDLHSAVLGEDYTPPKKEEGIRLPRITIDPFLSFVDEECIDSALSEEEKETKRKEFRAKRITEFGTLTHQMLEDHFLNREGTYDSYFQEDKEQKAVLQAAEALKNNFLTSSFYKKIEAMEKLPEQEFLIRDGDTLVEGIIDLLCVNEEKVVIIDYKTDSIRYETDHRNQLFFYVNAMKTIYPEKKVEAYVFYLRDPENVLGIT